MLRFWRRCGTLLADFKSTAVLPENERAIAEVIGRGRAIRLSHRLYHLKPYSHQRGGIRGALYVPKRCNNAFVELVGDRADAEALVLRFCGEQLQLTGCRAVFMQLQHHAIRFLRRHGMPVALLARISFMTERNARRICAGVMPQLEANAALAEHIRTLQGVSFHLAQRPYIGEFKT